MSNQVAGFNSRQDQRPWMTWLLIGIHSFVYLCMTSSVRLFPTASQVDWIKWGAVHPVYVWSGEVWRLVSAIFLHGHLLHLLLNCLVLFQVGRLLEPLLGSARFLFVFIVTGVTSFAFSLLLNSSITIGSSGAIFGLVGALLGLFFILPKKIIDEGLLISLLWFVGINIAFGFFLNWSLQSLIHIDNVAHLSGLFSGTLLGVAFAFDTPWRSFFEGRKNMWRRVTSTVSLVFAFIFLFACVGLSIKPFFSANYYYQMGLHALLQNKTEEALQFSRQLEKITTIDARKELLLGKIAVREGHLEIAKRYFQQAFLQSGNLSAVWDLNFKNFYQGGDLNEILFMDEKANQLLCTTLLSQENQKFLPEMFNDCAWLFLMSKHSTKADKYQALVWIKKAIYLSKDPKPEILHTLAEAYAQNGKIHEAMMVMERIILQKPEGYRFFLDEKNRFEKLARKADDNAPH